MNDNDAIQDLTRDLDAVLAGLDRAMRSLDDLIDGPAWQVEYAEGGVGGDLIAHLDAAALAVRAAKAVNLQAANA